MAHNNQYTGDHTYYLLAALFGELPYIVDLLTAKEVNALSVWLEYPKEKVWTFLSLRRVLHRLGHLFPWNVNMLSFNKQY